MATAVAGGAMLLSANSANASTKIDDSHVQVVAGDTLSKIAEENNTTVDQLVKDNHIANKDLIHVGDKLVIVPGATDQTAQATVNTVSNNNQASQSTQAQSTQPAQASATTNNSIASASTGSVHDQFIAAGGTEAMWNSIVIPESGGNPNATNGQYSGLGQTNQSWGTGSVAEQTRGMINYAISRYGSVENAINVRNSQNWW